MNRERFAWTVSLVVITLLAFELPGSLAQRDDEYAFVRKFVDIHRRVEDNYVESVDEDKLRNGAIDGLLNQLDPYSMYVPPAQQEAFDRMLEGSFKGVGIQLNQTDDGKVEVVTPIDGSPAFKAGVMAGDVILKVNGEDIAGLRIADVQKKIQGPLGSEVKMTVRHATGDEAELTMTREEVVVPPVKGFQRRQDNSWDYYICEDPKIAYIRVTQFTQEVAQPLREALEGLIKDGMKGFILDLRFNPGGRLDQAISVVDMLVDKGVILSTKGLHRPESIVNATQAGTLPKFPMIVLVNEHSASASEVVAGSLKDNHRALIIGQRSYGKGSVQEVIPLDSNGGELKLTVAYYYLPSGRLVHRKKDSKDWGVDPQITVDVDAQGEVKIYQALNELDRFRKPVKPSTNPTTGPTSTASATTQGSSPSLDVQLQRAVDTMIALTVLLQNQPNADVTQVIPPTTKPVAIAPVTPTSQPATTQASH
jgi:carboxyl-terminal processing protease